MPIHLTGIETVTTLPDPADYEPGYPVVHEGNLKAVNLAQDAFIVIGSGGEGAERGIGLGATALDPAFNGLAAGVGAVVVGDYNDGVLLAPFGEMNEGPNGWQDGVVIGPYAEGSGEAIAIGPSAIAYHYAAMMLSDYPSGVPSHGDIAIGGYVDVGNYDKDNNSDALASPGIDSPLTLTPDGSSQVPAELQQFDVGFIVRNASSWVSGSVASQAGGLQGNLITADGALNNLVGDVTAAYVRFRGVWDLGDGNFFGGWQYLQLDSVTDPLTYQFDGSEITVPSDSDDRDSEPFPFPKPVYSNGVDTSRILIGYSATMTNPALEGVSVGALNALDHERAILLGPNLSSERPYQAKVGGPAHVFTAPGGIELRTITATVAHTIDGDGAGGTNKETVVLADASSAGFDVTLPAVVSGRTVIIKKIDASANVVGVATPGAETIDGAGSDSLATQYDVIRLMSDGTNWFKI